MLRQAGLKKAFVSSSSDDGTQMLYKAAPDLIVPVLRPYRRRGETGSWIKDPSIIAHVEARLKANTYAGIGEFHAYGADADTPVMRRMVRAGQGAQDLPARPLRRRRGRAHLQAEPARRWCCGRTRASTRSTRCGPC